MSKARQFIKDYTRGCSNELCAVEDRYGKKVISYHEWLTPEQALAAVEIARKELIEKAAAYINEKFYFNNLHYAVENNTFNCMEELFEDFKKYMEG